MNYGYFALESYNIELFFNLTLCGLVRIIASSLFDRDISVKRENSFGNNCDLSNIIAEINPKYFVIMQLLFLISKYAKFNDLMPFFIQQTGMSTPRNLQFEIHSIIFDNMISQFS